MTDSPAASGSDAMDDTQATPVKPQRGKAPKAAKARKAPKPKGAPGRLSGCLGALLNLLTLVFVVGTCLSAAGVALLFQHPYVLRFVPGGSTYMPSTDPAVALVLFTPTAPASTAGTIGTASASFPTLPPAWTATLTPTVTATPAPGTPSQEPSATMAVPTYTATWTATPTAVGTKGTPTKVGPTPKPTHTRSAMAFNLQTGSPTYLANFLNTSGCNWFGIVGRAFGLDGNPVINLTVHMEGGGINADVVTGSGPSALGPGGYQIPIADHPIDTTDTYHIVLRNNTGTSLSDIYSVRTFGDCAKNTVMVNFTQTH